MVIRTMMHYTPSKLREQTAKCKSCFGAWNRHRNWESADLLPSPSHHLSIPKAQQNIKGPTISEGEGSILSTRGFKIFCFIMSHDWHVFIKQAFLTSCYVPSTVLGIWEQGWVYPARPWWVIKRKQIWLLAMGDSIEKTTQHEQNNHREEYKCPLWAWCWM